MYVSLALIFNASIPGAILGARMSGWFTFGNGLCLLAGWYNTMCFILDWFKNFGKKVA